MTPVALVVLVCAAQVCAQIGAYTWPALLPRFIAGWQISNSEAGWITALFYAAYTVSVPVLVTLTDRVDPRSVYLAGVGLTVVSHAAFASLVDGPWGAAVARAVAGVGWAGTYMTGLKLLADRVDPALMSRAVAGHAAGIGVAGALSFVMAGTLAAWAGWRGAFVGAAACALAAWLMVFVFVPRRAQPSAAPRGAALFDFRPVLRNRSALAYALAYCVHTWEMNALRGWAVAFLTWVAATTTEPQAWLAPTIVATTMGLVGTWASVAGNELSIRVGRQRLVRLAMAASVVCAAGIGFVGGRSYAVASVLVLVYGMLIWLDSSSLTAGAAGSAEPQRRGATLAVHSMLGYTGGFLGPLVVGWVLDLSGGMSTLGWGLAFLHIALVVLAGRLAFVWLRPRDLTGDRATAALGTRQRA
ncbi:MAG TPA: MFS transporter [Solirubrobacteraceae bacterium]|jgi:predicted MFS family arabinose efflux permease